jgi:hypothetical protein
LEKSAISDLNVAKNMEKQGKRKSPNKKIAIEVQVGLYGALVALIV